MTDTVSTADAADWLRRAYADQTIRALQAEAEIARMRLSSNDHISETGNSLAAAAEIARLREAIRRLADQDATLSVQGGNVTVTLDATLTDAEREAIELAVHCWTQFLDVEPACEAAGETLRSLLERLA